MKLKLFRILWGVDALLCIIILFFFFLGIVDGSVSSFNIGIWIIILIVLTFILGGSIWLKKLEYTVLANVLLMALAIPGFLFGLFILLFALSGTSWN